MSEFFIKFCRLGTHTVLIDTIKINFDQINRVYTPLWKPLLIALQQQGSYKCDLGSEKNVSSKNFKFHLCAYIVTFFSKSFRNFCSFFFFFFVKVNYSLIQEFLAGMNLQPVISSFSLQIRQWSNDLNDDLKLFKEVPSEE